MANAQAVENVNNDESRSADDSADPWAQARALMVASQTRVNDVTDLRIQRALRALRREAFVGAATQNLAYAEIEVDSAGRKLLKPRDLAKLLQALELRTGERALEIGGGAGYGAAAMALMGAEVTLLESPAAILAAQAAFAANRLPAPATIADPSLRQALAGRTFDVILVNGAVEFVPEEWLNALAEGARLAAILREGPVGRARIYTKSGALTAFRTAFDAAPSLLQGFAKKPEFAF